MPIKMNLSLYTTSVITHGIVASFFPPFLPVVRLYTTWHARLLSAGCYRTVINRNRSSVKLLNVSVELYVGGIPWNVKGQNVPLMSHAMECPSDLLLLYQRVIFWWLF